MTSKPSKTVLLMEIMHKHDTLDAIGPAWRLYLWLVLIEGGRVVGSYDEIAEKIGVNSRLIRNWSARLEEKGITQNNLKGKRVEISLLEPHKSISMAPDCIEKELPNSAPTDDTIMGMLQMYEGAKKAKSNIEMKVIFNAGDTTHK